MNITNTLGMREFYGRGLYKAGYYLLPTDKVPYAWAYRSGAFTNTAGSSIHMDFDAGAVNDDLAAYARSGDATNGYWTSMWARQVGTYLLCATVSTWLASTTTTFNQWILINSSEAANTIVEELQMSRGTNSSTDPNQITATAVFRTTAQNTYFHCYWGASVAMTGVTGQYATSFGIYKIG